MRDRVEKLVSQMNRAYRKCRRKKLWLSLLSLVVAVSTMLALLLPAFTLSKPVYCGKEEHCHSEECYGQVLICGKEESEEHIHSDECYESRLLCGLEEHEHGLACTSDPEAVESEAFWKSSFPLLEEKTPRERLLALAASQLGYRESVRNFLVQEDGSVRGYTRYGAWYGDPYGDWGAMFLSFCLYYAGVERNTVPYESDCARWADALTLCGLFVPAERHLLREGELVFLDDDGDHLADRAALAYHVEAGSVELIEGDSADQVGTYSLALNDPCILGFGVLPLDEEKAAAPRTDDEAVECPAQSFWGELEGLSVSVEADEGAFPADTVMELRPVDGEELRDAVSDAVEGKVLWVQAVDISFFDAGHRELQPRIPIRVVIRLRRGGHQDRKGCSGLRRAPL